MSQNNADHVGAFDPYSAERSRQDGQCRGGPNNTVNPWRLIRAARRVHSLCEV